MCSTIHPVQSSRSDGSFMKRSSVEVLRISEISENSESAKVGDTVISETSLIKSDIESINCAKTTSPFQKAFEVHDVGKRIIEKVT